MPKIQKEAKKRKEKVRDLESQKIQLKQKMFSSSVKTYLFAAIFLIISFIFNGQLIPKWVDTVSIALGADSGAISPIVLLDLLIKSFSIILFFFFSFVSIGNWRELSGYILTWKEMTILLVFSLIQATTDGSVFIISSIGIVIILFYMYFIQGKIEKEIF